jgi:hypothetical protein
MYMLFNNLKKQNSSSIVLNKIFVLKSFFILFHKIIQFLPLFFDVEVFKRLLYTSM